MNRAMFKTAGQLLKWYLWIASGLVSALIILMVITLSIILWYPKTAQISLPYLEQLTNGQLKIESAEGKFVDGLSLKNIQLHTSTLDLQIAQMDWQWNLSALFHRHASIQSLTLTQPHLKMRSTNGPVEPNKPPNLKPFERLTQLNQYGLLLDIEQMVMTQARLQIDNQSPLEISAFKSGLHWQEQTLHIRNLNTRLRPNINTALPVYEVQAHSQFTVLNARQFTLDLSADLLGVKGFEPFKIKTQATGDMAHINITFDMLAPYEIQTQHQLNLGKNSLELHSEFKNVYAQFHPQWQVNQLQGTHQLKVNLDQHTFSSQGKLQATFADKPAVNLDVLAHSTQDGHVYFDVNTQFKEMGSFKTHGQAHLKTRAVKANVQTEQLNLQWFDANLNYQLTSLLELTLSDFKTLTSQLDIQQLQVNGLPEPFTFKGVIKSELKNKLKPNTKSAVSDYALTIQSRQLNYADHSGQIMAAILASPDFKTFEVPYANLTLGDNTVYANGQWAESLNLSLNIALNQLHQLYAPLSGQISGQIDSNGTVLKDFSGFDQAWSNVQLKANNLRYQTPGANNNDALTLNNLQIKGRVPLHNPAWSAFTLSASDLQHTSDLAPAQERISALKLSRQAFKKGLLTELTISHSDLELKAEVYENAPSIKQSTFALNRLDIDPTDAEKWQLLAPYNLLWSAPAKIQTPQMCLRPVNQTNANITAMTDKTADAITEPTHQKTGHLPNSKPAQVCLQVQSDRAEWSMQSLPILEWLKPWLNQAWTLKGTLTGQGSAHWQKTLTAKQSVWVPKLDITVVEQGYKLPILIKDWQTDFHLTPTQLSVKSAAQINETGHLNTHLNLTHKTNQAWSKALIDGKIHLQLNEWQLGERVLERIELNQTKLTVHSDLSGSLNTLQHQTTANIDVNLNLPLLGLTDQAIQLNAQLTPENVQANGTWTQLTGQKDQRSAELNVTLSQFLSQPKVLANFKTQSIELLKTPFAELKTASDITLTLENGTTHIQGQVQLHDSQLNLDEMPLHQNTATSGDEIVIDKQGQVITKPNAMANLSYDLKIGFGDKVEVNMQQSQFFLGGQLQVVQAINAPTFKALGKVSITKGYLNLDARNRIQIDESDFSFSGNIGNPTLNVNLFRVVDQTTARLNITGTATQPQFVFYSTPSLSQGRIINLMVFGRAGDLSKEPNYESQILSAFYTLGIQNNTPVLNTLTSTLGIQDVYLDVQDQRVSSLLVGRALTDKLYVRYAKDLTGQQNNVVQFFYQLTQKWLLKTNSGGNKSSVDLIYRLEKP